jgi:hypothetical protein
MRRSRIDANVRDEGVAGSNPATPTSFLHPATSTGTVMGNETHDSLRAIPRPSSFRIFRCWLSGRHRQAIAASPQCMELRGRGAKKISGALRGLEAAKTLGECTAAESEFCVRSTIANQQACWQTDGVQNGFSNPG